MTILLASTLAYKYKKKVVVLDCDTLQQSVTKSRINDIGMISPYETVDAEGNKCKMVRDGVMYKAVKEQNIAPYEIVRCNEDVNDIVEYLLKKDEEGCDYAFLDLPGNVDNKDYFRIVSLCSIVFLPFIVDALDFDSNFDFAKHTYQKIFEVHADCNLKKMYGYWTKYDTSCRPLYFQSYCDKISSELPGVEMLKYKMGYTKAVGNDRCRNTLLPPASQFLGYGKIGAVLNEMYDKIKNI